MVVAEHMQRAMYRQPHELFIFCSSRLPAVILPDSGHLQVDILDFVAGPPPVLESSASLYVRTCHPGESGAEPSARSA